MEDEMTSKQLLVTYLVGLAVSVCITFMGTSNKTTDAQYRRYLSMCIVWPIFVLVVVAGELTDFLNGLSPEDDEDT